MARIKSAAHAAVAHATDAAVHAADAAVHAAATARSASAATVNAADTAVHAAATARSASAATRSAAAAVAAAARDSCPASTEPEEDTEIDLELGTPESSSTSSSSSSTPSSLSSSSFISTLRNFKEMFGWFDSWSDIISQIVLTAFMGGPIYPSYKLISKKAEPQYMLFFILYCCIWICINTYLVFVFLGRSKKEKSLSLWLHRLYMMADCISMVIYLWALIPNTYGVNLGAGILISVVVFSHMTAWNISLPNPCSSNESDNDLEG